MSVAHKCPGVHEIPFAIAAENMAWTAHPSDRQIETPIRIEVSNRESPIGSCLAEARGEASVALSHHDSYLTVAKPSPRRKRAAVEAPRDPAFRPG